MGSHRLLLWAAILVPFLCLAEWSQSDSAFLQAISVDVGSINLDIRDSKRLLTDIDSHVSSMELFSQSWNQLFNGIALDVDDLPGIASDVGAIESDVDYIRQYNQTINSNVADAVVTLSGIADLLDDILSDIRRFEFANQSSQVEQYNHRSVYVHDVRTDDIDYKLSLFGTALTNQLNALDYSVNNLTNYFIFGSGFPTNSLVTLMPPTHPDDLDEEMYSYYYYLLTGVDPDPVSLSYFMDAYYNLGSYQTFSVDTLKYLVRPDNIGLSDEEHNVELAEAYEILSSVPIFDTIPSFEDIGKLYYSEYGTYGILQELNNLSNLLFATEGDYLTKSSSPSGSSWSLGATASSALTGIKESVSFTGTVGTNVVGSVLEGPIESIVDQDYNSSLNQIKQSHPSSFSQLDGVLSEINGVKGTADDIVNLLDNADHNNDFVISGDIAMPRIGTQTLSITIPNQVNRMGPIVNFFCVCMEFFMLIYFVSVAWDDIVQVVFGRRLL